MTHFTFAIFNVSSSPAELSSKSRMRTSALLTLFFSFFFVIEMVFCIPLSIPARSYVPGALGEFFFFKHHLIHGWYVHFFTCDLEEILGSQNKRITVPVASPIEMFLRKLARPGLREMQLQIDDYCSKFPCPTPSECRQVLQLVQSWCAIAPRRDIWNLIFIPDGKNYPCGPFNHIPSLLYLWQARPGHLLLP